MRFSPIVLLLFGVMGFDSVAHSLVPPAYADEQVETQEQAIAAIKKLGGKVTLDEKSPIKPVIKVDFNRTKVTDDDLMHLKGLTKLSDLGLFDTKITDSGLEHLKRLTYLERLDLSSTNVTDAGLKHLKGLTELSKLYLDNTKVTDAGLVHLKGLTNLQTLYIRNTQVTDEGVQKLQTALPKCRISH